MNMSESWFSVREERLQEVVVFETCIAIIYGVWQTSLFVYVMATDMNTSGLRKQRTTYYRGAESETACRRREHKRE